MRKMLFIPLPPPILMCFNISFIRLGLGLENQESDIAQQAQQADEHGKKFEAA